MSGPHILVVEDDPAAARYMVLALGERFAGTEIAASGEAALRAVTSKRPDLVFLDVSLPDIDGLDLLTLVKRTRPDLPVVMVTAADDVPTVVEAIRRGATNYLVKPVPPAALLGAVHKALHAPAPPKAADPLLPELIGVSRTMVEVRGILAVAARSDVNVLLVGETGTGKELAARAIHRLSGRQKGPFVSHNCATISSELFDSEFFGHRRGAFTGAERDHDGLLVRANGGTLFLDELASMGLAQQAKLLRVLDDGEVRPLGADGAQAVHVRFLAATHRPAVELVGTGGLREDLYYRLLGFEIALPPLRDRLEDVPALAEHFLGSDASRLTVAALESLRCAPWPGNVRQLRNVLLAANTRAGTGPIEARHVAQAPGPVVTQAPPGSIRQMERSAILRALEDAKGNRSRAARALGIDRSTLRRKLHDATE